LNKKIWKRIAIFGIVVSILLFVLSFYQVKSHYENILPIHLSPEDNETVAQFKVKITYPLQIIKNQKTRLQFELNYIDSENINKSTKTTDVNSLDLFEKFSNNFESRLELPGVHIEPSGVISQNFVKNKILNHKWELYPDNPGEVNGTLWLYINLIPENPSDDLIHEILLAKPIQIDVITIFGLSSIWVRILSTTLLLFSLFIRFKIFINEKERVTGKAL
jgi:hypothetical protein